MTVLSVLATFFGTFQALANLPQAYKIFKRRSSKDVSLTTYLIFLVGSVVWVLYGIEIGSFAVIFSNALGVVTLVVVIIGWFTYR
jgi:MtN3 and saliva related transmembrane protein